MTCTSPLASAGFKILDASIAPSAPPAPMSVCISSINKMTFPSLLTSSRIFFKRSSNSPRYLVPATSDPISSIIKRSLSKFSGTQPSTMACAKPSTTAVLPTPGSPKRTGLFFVLRLKIWIIRLTSFSRPITGSIMFSAAISVMSRPSSSKVGVFDFPCCSSAFFVTRRN